MIVVRLVGGLGNQMFQYATGLSVAENLGADLFIDNSWFKKPLQNETPRKYELDKFNIENKIVNPKNYTLKTEGFFSKLYKIGKPSLNYYKEKSFRYDPNFKYIKNNTYLDGYFQSEKYFKNIRPSVMRKFEILDKISDKSKDLIGLTKKYDSVSIHVRRGDYVSNKNANEFHGILSQDYYKKAIGVISKKVNKPRFFIFSDEIDWVKDNFDLPQNSFFVDHSKSGIEDLRIMIECKHNIIANSSFSWWGAWLGKYEGKKVLAPKHWFKDNSIDTSDLFPSNWHLL